MSSDSAWIDEGTNRVNVTVVPGLGADAPTPSVDLDYSHEATSEQSRHVHIRPSGRSLRVIRSLDGLDSRAKLREFALLGEAALRLVPAIADPDHTRFVRSIRSKMRTLGVGSAGIEAEPGRFWVVIGIR